MSRDQTCLGYAMARKRRRSQRFSVSHMSRDQPMEQREQKPNLFGLCRVVTEEDEAKLAWAMPWRDLTTNREQYQARLNIAEVRRKKTKSIFRSSESRTLSLLNCYAECRRKSSSIKRRRNQHFREAHQGSAKPSTCPPYPLTMGR